jgi:hypothetical protein
MCAHVYNNLKRFFFLRLTSITNTRISLLIFKIDVELKGKEDRERDSLMEFRGTGVCETGLSGGGGRRWPTPCSRGRMQAYYKKKYI